MEILKNNLPALALFLFIGSLLAFSFTGKSKYGIRAILFYMLMQKTE